jgi:DNA-binding transcriptional LysR family regulator
VQTRTAKDRERYSPSVATHDDFNWDDLRYFLRAAQTKTLAGAARSMGVEHTTIGRRLSALERSLGAPLVLRGPDGLTLTPMGERIAPLVQELERGVLAVRELVTSQRERVRVALPSGFTGLFTEDLARLRQEHPGVTLETVSGGRAVDLKSGEADLAVRIGPVTDDDLVVRSLGEVGWSLYASAAYLGRRPAPADPNDLTGHDIIAYGADVASLPAARWIEDHAAHATVVLRSNETMTMLAATVSGTGLAVLPCFLAEAEPTLKRLTPEVLATRGVSLVYRREVRLAEPVRVAIRFVVEVMRNHADRISGAPVPR